MQDLVNAVKIADKEQRLDRTPPPPKPQFPDDDLSQPLGDNSMPLPIDATVSEQRRATIPQMKNLIDRLRRFEVWKLEQAQQEQ